MGEAADHLLDDLRRRSELRARFDRIFRRSTGFATLDRLLQRLHANKAELLMVLDHPEIPLHTNGSENDIRCQVTKRQVSGGTHSDIGRDCRDAFLGLAKTCRKLGIAFWDCLGARLGVFDGPEQDHRGIKGRCRPMLGFKSTPSARRYCQGHDELRNFLRIRSRMRQHVPAATRRFRQMRRTAIALGILEAA
jgi:hypothetical protein